jgi:putative redox protein
MTPTAPGRMTTETTGMITANVKLTQPSGTQRQFVATSGTGHHILIDDAAGNTGAKPIELVAIALAGCTAFDVIGILRKKRQEVTGYEVTVEADQTPDPPQVFTKVRIHHIVTGVDIAEQALRDAIRLSEEKYCSVGAMVNQSAEIESTYEIVHAVQPVAVGE